MHAEKNTHLHAKKKMCDKIAKSSYSELLKNVGSCYQVFKFFSKVSFKNLHTELN